MLHTFRPALVLLALFTLLLGVAYPLAMTGIGQALFPYAANGSPLVRDGQVVGSALIGQSFTRDDYFWGRPSAAGDGYNARASSGSNLGPTAQALADRISAEAARYGVPASEIPVGFAHRPAFTSRSMRNVSRANAITYPNATSDTSVPNIPGVLMIGMPSSFAA